MRTIRSRCFTGAAVAGAVVALALTGCTTGSGSSAARGAPSPSPSSSPSASPSPSPSPSATPSPSLSPSPSASPSASPSPSPAKAAPPAAKPAPRTPLLVEQLADVGNATQVVIVTSKGYGTTYAVLRTYEKRPDGWHKVFGDMPARIGKSGFSRGTRQQGDGTTPSGKFGLGFMFGTNPRPSGVQFEYRPVTKTSWWVGDFSPAAMKAGIYNTWADSGTKNGVDFSKKDSEDLHTYAAYKYAQVIEFNMHPTVARRGAAIFLHTNPHHSATAGCVAIDELNLLKVMRWLRPGSHPVIVMAPDSQIRKY